MPIVFLFVFDYYYYFFFFYIIIIIIIYYYYFDDGIGWWPPVADVAWESKGLGHQRERKREIERETLGHVSADTRIREDVVR